MSAADRAAAGRAGVDPASAVGVATPLSRPSTSRPDLLIRPARAGDLPACADVWHVSISDYIRRLNQPEMPLNVASLVTLLGHLLATDPTRFLVAQRTSGNRDGEAGRIVAFAAAAQREQVWYLSMLFVEPVYQGAGLGRELLVDVFPGRDGVIGDSAARTPGVMALATDSAQPISNALYAGYGIVPRVPLFNLVGRPRTIDALPALPEGIAALPFSELGPSAGNGAAGAQEAELLADAVDWVDRQVLGYAHPEDHAFLRRTGRLGFLFRGPAGEVLGYGYTSEVGRVGPIAILDETLTAPVLGHLLTVVPPAGASSIWIAGPNDRAFVALLRAGLRFDGLPCLLCWTRPFADFTRYIPASLALI